MKKLLPLLVLIPFFVFSVEVALKDGVLGFLPLAGREPWAMQMLFDLVISFFFAGAWLRRDARERGIPALPYLVGIVLTGSIGVLAYMVHRAFAAPAPAAPSPSARARAQEA